MASSLPLRESFKLTSRRSSSASASAAFLSRGRANTTTPIMKHVPASLSSSSLRTTSSATSFLCHRSSSIRFNNTMTATSPSRFLSSSSKTTPPPTPPPPSASPLPTPDTEEDKDDNTKVEETAAAPPPPPTPKGEEMSFQAETKQLLDIVTNSLYTDKEVFLRELVSNASDALEKLRHFQQSNIEPTIDSDIPLEIRIELNEVDSSITITDTGIGMTKEEMIENLGTIAKSGSKAFLKQLDQNADTEKNEANHPGLDISRGIIGKFGVGFYSAFMVGTTVEVRSKSALAQHQDVAPKTWKSHVGEASFEIADLRADIRQNRGSSIVIYLKEEFWDYCNESKIEKILKTYSNFVNFPIFLNGTRVNTLEAVWAKDPREVTEEQYVEFYKYLSNNVDEPIDTYHFRADAPLDVKALFYIPSFHSEKYGMERMSPGVSLYSRKVLIESKCADILPDWLRFIKGVVDSEDLPLAISREKPQDSALIAKLRTTLTRKVISFLTKMAKKDRTKYVDEFYNEYAYFIKEGICQDHQFKDQLSKLLYFQTSKSDSNISLDEYIGNMRPEQQDIYYLCSPNREAAKNSPYLEAFDQANVEVLFMYTSIEDFVMANLEKFEGRKLVTVEKGDIDLNELTKINDDKKKNDKASKDGSDDDNKEENKNADIYKHERKLTIDESIAFCNWFKKTLGEDKVASCIVTERLSSSPAIVTDNESGAVRRMMKLVDTQAESKNGSYVPIPKQSVQLNPQHRIIVGLSDIYQDQPALAKVMAEQVYDNCLIAAGLIDDSRIMLPRLNDIMLGVVKNATMLTKKNTAGADSDADSVSDSDSDSDSDAEEKKEEKFTASSTTIVEGEVIEAEVIEDDTSSGEK